MKFELLRPKILSQHVDTLVSTFKATKEDDYKRYISKILTSLDEYKEQAQEVEGFSNKSRFFKCEPFVGFGTFRMFAQGTGQFRFILENEDIMLFMSNAKFDSDAPQIKVEFRAHYLFAVGQNRAYEYVLKLVAQLLGTSFASSVQRLDLATDIWGVKLEYLDPIRFQNSFTNNNFRKASKQTGISFGGGAFMFRIYDKLEEISKNYSKHFIKSKWIINGFDESQGYHVTRFEAQFRREQLKKYIPTNHQHEIAYVFNNLGKFWLKALAKIKYAPLTNDECMRVVDGEIKSDSKRQIFKRARDDENRYQFQYFLSHWDNSISDHLVEYRTINEPKIEIAKRMLKGFIGSTYKAMEANPNALSDVLGEMQSSMIKYENMTLHDYGLTRVIDSFIKQEKMKNKFGVEVVFDFSLIANNAYQDLSSRFKNIDNVFMNIPSLAKSENIEDYFKHLELERVV